MRYWIWWNDLVQGPFELDELTSLKAFSEDLMVCMEDRADWLPASRVADLSSAIEQVKARRLSPRTPPPPPPRRSPGATPLQGEFFGEAPGQGRLIDDEPTAPKGPYAYLPVTIESGDPLSSYFSGAVTSPFHFSQPPQGPIGVLDLPAAVRPKPLAPPIPEAWVYKQSPVPDMYPKPAPEPALAAAALEAEPIALNIVETLPETLPETTPEPQVEPSLAPSLEEPAVVVPARRWVLSVLGTVMCLGLIAAGGYWWLQRHNTNSAIQEALQKPAPEPITPPEVNVIPVAVEPVPVPKAVKPARRAKAKKTVKAVIPKAAVVKAKKVAVTPPAVALPGIVEMPVEVPPAPEPVAEHDQWSNRQTEAIEFVMNRLVPGSKVSIKTQAKAMLDGMHEKELIHAAKTGERLYLPDKISWAALREDGARYRVYVNFLAWRAAGDRVQTRSYQFLADLKAKTLRTDDGMTQQDFFKPSADLSLKHNPMAVDIESILGGVDFYNKQKMNAMIVKNGRKNRDARKTIEASLAQAKQKLERAVVFFRKTYTDEALNNVAKAYDFAELLKS